MNVLGLAMMFAGGLVIYLTLSLGKSDGLADTQATRGESGFQDGRAGEGGAPGGGGSW